MRDFISIGTAVRTRVHKEEGRKYGVHQSAREAQSNLKPFKGETADSKIDQILPSNPACVNRWNDKNYLGLTPLISTVTYPRNGNTGRWVDVKLR